MTPEATLNLITAIAGLAWVAGLIVVVRAGRSSAAAAAASDWWAEGAAPSSLLAGSAVLSGESPQSLAERARTLLASGRAAEPLSTARIDAATGDTITFEVALRGGGGRTRGRLAFVRDGGGTRADWTYQPLPGRSLLIAARCLLVASFMVLVGLHLLLRGTVLGHPEPGVRWQVIQMVQVVHLLWPPFLFVGLRHGLRAGLRNATEAFVANLPHARAAG